MLTKDERNFLKKIPADKIVKIYPFNKRTTETAEKIIQSINDVYPDLEVKHMGASALCISGQNDLDIYAFSDPLYFNNYLSVWLNFLANRCINTKLLLNGNLIKMDLILNFI